MKQIIPQKIRTQLVFLIAIALVSAGTAFLLSQWWHAEMDARTARTQTQTAEEVKQEFLDSSLTEASSSSTVSKNASARTQTPVIGVLEIPKLGLQRVIAEGITNKTLNDPHSGVGHYPGSAMPGDWGNFSISGHRNGNGGTFFDLDKVRKGDLLKITTADGVWNYRVTKTSVLEPDDNEVLLNIPTTRTITITTCHPKWSDKQRLVVVGELEL